MRKRILSLVVIMGIAAVGIFAFSIVEKPRAVKAEIQNNFVLMAKESKNRPLSSEVIASSNPYDYVDSKYYDNIIAMGTEAIEPLEELMESDEISGPYLYVSAVAMQDITGCDMQEVTGTDWSNVDQFKELWNITMQDLPETLEDIQNDTEMSAEEKVRETEKYGLFGKAYLKRRYKELGSSISKKDAENVMKYMEKKHR